MHLEVALMQSVNITQKTARGGFFLFFFPESASWKLFVHSECSDCNLKAGLSSESEQF